MENKETNNNLAPNENLTNTGKMGDLSHGQRQNKINWKVNLLLIFCSTLFALVLAEIMLRFSGISFTIYPQFVVRYKQIEENFLPDETLFWVSLTYPKRLEKARQDKPDIVFMGDSCTEYGWYPQLFIDKVHSAFPQIKLKYFNAGVTGWSTHNGLLQLKRDILPLKPKFITVFYGWNDHWLCLGFEDKKITDINSYLKPEAKTLRLWQLMFKTYLVLYKTSISKGDECPLRVSPEDFKRNLTEIARLAKENNIVPIFITAPQGHIPGKEPEFLKGRWVKDLKNLIPLHQYYVNIVRETANRENVILCDLAKEFELIPQDKIFEYLSVDGIHFNIEGNKLAADVLFKIFIMNDLLSKLSKDTLDFAP